MKYKVVLKPSAAPVKKKPIRLTAEDKADIRAARRSKKEYLRTGESYTVEELMTEFNL